MAESKTQQHTAPAQALPKQAAPLAVQKQRTIIDLIHERRSEFLKVIPKRLDPDRLLRVAQSAVSRNPRLLAATPATIMRGIMQAASLGLEIDVLGEAYLVPFKNGELSRKAGHDVYEAQFLPGYRGLVKLARRSGVIDTINAKIVRKDDEFDYSDGSESFIHHKPALRRERGESEVEENAEIIAAYMVAWIKGSTKPQIEVMDRADIMRIQARSRAKSSGPWVTDWAEMARKCPVRRGSKYLPTEADFGRALAAEDRFESGFPAADLFPELPEKLPGEEEQEQKPKGTAEQLAEKMGVAPKQQEAPPVDDDVAFETREEEQARLSREAQQTAEGE